MIQTGLDGLQIVQETIDGSHGSHRVGWVKKKNFLAPNFGKVFKFLKLPLTKVVQALKSGFNKILRIVTKFRYKYQSEATF